VAESCTVCSSCSRLPVRKLLGTPSYIPLLLWPQTFRSKQLFSQSRNSPPFYVTRKCTTMFTRSRHWLLRQMNSVHLITPYFLNIHFNNILHLCLGFSSDVSYRFQTKIIYAFLISPTRATRPANLILRDFIALIIRGEKDMLQINNYVTLW
jgi:hypothetical protein